MASLLCAKDNKMVAHASLDSFGTGKSAVASFAASCNSAAGKSVLATTVAATKKTSPVITHSEFCRGFDKHEDRSSSKFAHIQKLYNNRQSGESIVHNVSMFGVFDGHGGNKVSEYLKKNLFDIMLKHFNTDELNFRDRSAVVARIKAACAEADENICRQGCGVTGSTGVLAIVIDDTLYMANTGDSGGIMAHNGNVIFETNDHDYDTNVEEKRIIDASSKCCAEHGRRGQALSDTRITMKDSHMIVASLAYGSSHIHRRAMKPTRAYGHQYRKEAGCLSSEPDVQVLELDQPGEYKIVLMTDGVLDIAENKMQVLAKLGTNPLTEAANLGAWANSRWKQTWEFVDDQGKVLDPEARFGSSDDITTTVISVVVPTSADGTRAGAAGAA